MVFGLSVGEIFHASFVNPFLSIVQRQNTAELDCSELLPLTHRMETSPTRPTDETGANRNRGVLYCSADNTAENMVVAAGSGKG